MKLELQNGKKRRDRLRVLWLSAAAVWGAVSSLMAAVLRPQGEACALPRPTAEAGKGNSAQNHPVAGSLGKSLEYNYSLDLVIGGPKSELIFQRSLLGIAAGPEDDIYALGDGEVRIFKADGSPAARWKAPAQAACLAVSRDQRVVLAFRDRVEIFSDKGKHMGGFAAGEGGRQAVVTAVKAFGEEILVADAAARHIRRYDRTGRQLGAIGTTNKTGGFMLPNRSLDMDVDARGIVIATDPGRHRVTFWAIDGAPLRHFGKFSQVNPEDFMGCCNPVNLAFTPGGNVVTAEKVAARVKVYSPEGRLMALIGPEHFDSKCTLLHLAVDSKGRIVVADPVRLVIKIFSPGRKEGSRGIV